MRQTYEQFYLFYFTSKAYISVQNCAQSWFLFFSFSFLVIFDFLADDVGVYEFDRIQNVW